MRTSAETIRPPKLTSLEHTNAARRCCSGELARPAPGLARPTGRRVRVVLAAAFSLLAFLAVSPTGARAAIVHDYLPEVSAEISRGVPAGEAPLAGRLAAVGALTVDSGHVWVADRIASGGSRVDAFDATTGGFVAPQLDEEEGVIELHQGVGVDHLGGEERVYVGAGQNEQGVVAVFDPATGKLGRVWTGAATANKSFTQNAGARAGVLSGVAVDNSTNIETAGDVYVSTFGVGDSSFSVVDVLRPAAGGAEPATAVAEILGTCATPETTCPGEEVPFAEPSGVAVSPANGDVLVTDGESVVDVFEPGVLGQYKFVRRLTGTPTGAGGAPVAFGRVTSVAADGKAGDIYVVDTANDQVDQFTADGVYRGRLTGTPEGSFGEPASVAVGPESEDVFVRDIDPVRKTAKVDVFGPTKIVPDVTTAPAPAVSIDGEGEIEATLHGTVNPLNEGAATCAFALGTTAAFGQSAACQPPEVADGNTAVPVQATISKTLTPSVTLAPDTTYSFRLQATNANGIDEGEGSEDQTFHTPGPGIHSTSASDVSSSSATLAATIDPNGAPTSVYFQYGKSTAYESETPAAPGESIGAAPGDVKVAPRHLQELTPGTVYHYRVVAVATLNVHGTPTAISFAGPDQTFTTQPAGEATVLPDARQWQLVSQPDKHGALLQPISETGLVQAASNGDAITYVASQPTEEGAKGFIYNRLNVLSTRTASGWSSQDISLPHSTATGLPEQEYHFFASDLSSALVQPQQFTPLEPEVFPPDTEPTPYVRHNSTCTSTPGTCFEPLVTAAPGYEDALAHHHPAGFDGATSDLAHVIVSSGIQLYEWSAALPPEERIQLISVPPGGGEAAKTAQLGFENSVATNAISADGAKVVWTENAGDLYLRVLDEPDSIRLDEPEPACVAEGQCGEGGAPTFQFASVDDSRIFFTDARQLTKDAGRTPGQADLYECAITGEAGSRHCNLTDITPESTPGQSADVQGAVLGGSEDGAVVYFVASGILGDGTARGAVQGDCKITSDITSEDVGEGECNLYARYDGQTQFIAVLAGADYPDWDAGGEALNQLTSRVSPNGEYLTFMSNRPLTGYDNHDAVSGKPDEEVFLYHESEAGRVVTCVSCNPTGARPQGVEYEKALNDGLAGGDRIWGHTWLAANVPGWTPYAPGFALYQSRYLSNSGRLFFNSSDALVPQDINHNEDVYEYEPPGVGNCTMESASYQPVSGGCLGLISSGRAAGESAFVDASENGDDVFFLTQERLVSKDIDNALDVYDAHVCSAAVPCVEEPAAPPACSTAESCRPAPTPQPSIFGAPSSATFSGQGNPPPATSTTTKPVSKPRRAQLLTKALATCRRKYQRHRTRRTACEHAAHRRYPAKSARTTKPINTGNR